MKIFVATRRQQGDRASDFCFVPEGEPLRLGSEEPGEPVDGGSGSRRALVGMDGHRATTTMAVAEWPGTLDEYVARYAASLRAAGFDPAAARREAMQLAEIAAAMPPKAVIEYRGGHFQPRFPPAKTPRAKGADARAKVARPPKKTVEKAPKSVQVFVATAATQGRRANDFHFAREGELLRTIVGADREADPDGPEGTARALVGMDSGRGTTTMEVVTRPMTPTAFLRAFAASLRAAGLDPVYATLDGPHLLHAAARFAPGDVVELRGGRFVRRDPGAPPPPAPPPPAPPPPAATPPRAPRPVQGTLNLTNPPRGKARDLSPRMRALLAKVDAYERAHPGAFLDVGAPDVPGATVAALLARDLIETWRDPKAWGATEEHFYGNVLRGTHGSSTRYRTKVFAKTTAAGRAALGPAT